MNTPWMVAEQNLADDAVMLGAYAPVPGMGVVPINAFLLRSAQPVLVDTGMAALREGFMSALRRALDPAELRWIWVTHADPDHVGNLSAVLAEAPQARVVTNFLGMAKLGLLGLPVDRVYLLNPGQSLDVGDRHLLAVAPPSFDAPETMAAFDQRQRTLFSADAFGALLTEPAEAAEAIPDEALRAGLTTWASIDAPWLQGTSTAHMTRMLQDMRALDARLIASSHLPPARGITDRLLELVDAARTAPTFVGPDQAALERMLASQAA
jgi:flavorubredoxin